ncbi:MAG: DUF998 domain-containing protein [Ignavibacteriales bacterium]|nr:DUF998 domain-containing protein [Ignavibacteriales bacterium]
MTTNDSPSISTYLTAGIVAGPFFILLALLQAFTRKGFDWVRHPASMLSLGDSGWIQIANFVLTGILFVLCGAGLRQALRTGIGSTWAPRLFVLLGVALIIGGVFTADPGLGFPPGAPEGAATEMSWHGTIHAFAPILGFLSQFAALIILARRFGSQGDGGMKIVTIVVAIAMFVLATVPNFTADWEKGVFNFLPLWVGVALGYTWTSFVIAKVRKEQTAVIG